MLNSTWPTVVVFLLLSAVTTLDWGVPPPPLPPLWLQLERRIIIDSTDRSGQGSRNMNTHTCQSVGEEEGGGWCISMSYCSFDIMTMTHSQFRFWDTEASRSWNGLESADIYTETYWHQTQRRRTLVQVSRESLQEEKTYMSGFNGIKTSM